jgi:hypothetical protein
MSALHKHQKNKKLSSNDDFRNNHQRTEDVDEDFHISEDSVVLEVTFEESVLPPAVPQVKHQVTKEAYVRVLNIH